LRHGLAFLSRQSVFEIARPAHSLQSGISLLELITVVTVLGALSVYAVPRMMDNSSFFARGFHDESIALLRYAQKTAIAQRRNVCATFTASSVQLSIAATAGGACDTALSGPAQNCSQGLPAGAKACVQARSGVSFSAAPSVLTFDALGQPALGAQVIQVALSGAPISRHIVVEDSTGYVHD
jgi:MSHA pilin protein MshC